MKPLACLLALWVRPVSASVAAEGGSQPNVLLLFSADQRADTLGALGNADIRTPALDGSRSRARRSRGRTAWVPTTARCVPSRARLLSGRTLFRVNDQLKGQTTWPEKFAQAGYTTFLTGKWHNGAESALRSFQRGKAIFLGGMGAPYHLPLQDIGAPRVFENQRASREHSVRAPLVLAGPGIPPGR